jgi:hypothetical protein
MSTTEEWDDGVLEYWSDGIETQHSIALKLHFFGISREAVLTRRLFLAYD